MQMAILMRYTFWGLFLLSSMALYSQRYSDPLTAVPAYENRQDLGVFVGLGQNWQSGDMFAQCEDCVFSGGTGFGFTLGALYEYYLWENFAFGVASTYRYLGFTAEFREIITKDHLYTDNGLIRETVNLRFKHTADVDIHNVSIAPYIKWTPWEFIFIRAGLGIGANISTNIKHTEELDQKTARLSNGEIVFIKNNSSKQYVQDTEIPDLKSLQIYFLPSIGFNIPFSEDVTFSPVFEYGLSLTEVSTFGNGLKINNWGVLLELRFKLTEEY